jgi:hypothetical protein
LRRPAPLVTALTLGTALCVVGLLFTACGSKREPSQAGQPAAEAAASPAASPAATVYRIEEAGIQFEAPSTWKAEKQGDEEYVVTSQDGGVSLTFRPVAAEAAEKEIAAWRKSVEEKSQNVRADAPRVADVGGLKHRTVAGTAEQNGARVVWSVAAVTDREKGVLVFRQSRQDAAEKHAAALDQITESIKKIGE